MNQTHFPGLSDEVWSFKIRRTIRNEMIRQVLGLDTLSERSGVSYLALEDNQAGRTCLAEEELTQVARALGYADVRNFLARALELFPESPARRNELLDELLRRPA